MSVQNDPVQLDPSDPFDMIALEAKTGEAEQDAEREKILNGGEEPPPVIDQAQIWAQIPKQVGGLLTMAMPELAGVYNDAACLAWGTGMAATAEKRGWDAGETIAKWGPEFMLATASFALVMPTVQAIKARKAAADKAKDQKSLENSVEAGQSAPEQPLNPMMQAPGGFSVPV